MPQPRWSRLQQMAQEETDRLLSELPPPIQERVRHVPVVFRRLPGQDLIDDGLEPDLMGLFVGDDVVHEAADPLPPEILLFLVNIWDEAEGDPERYRQEVRTTLLHEMGHYLGLDEEGLLRRDLA